MIPGVQARALCLVLLLAGCSRDLDGTGIARGLASNGAALALAADSDLACGFNSPSAELSVVGDIGELGSATWTIQDCVLDFAAAGDPCDATQRALAGTARVSGTRTVLGTITGNEALPVRPDGPDATSLSLTVEVDGFTGEGRHDLVALPSATGSFELEARLRRATGAGGGCTIASPNIAVSRLRYTGSLKVVDGVSTTVAIDDTELAAVRGRVAAEENTVSGSMVSGGSRHTIEPVALEQPYYPEAFVESAACHVDVALPVNYSCEAPSAAAATRLASGSAQALALIARLARDNKACGFAGAPSVLQVDSSSVSYEVKRIDGCRIEFGADSATDNACDGQGVDVRGAVTVTGSMRTMGQSTNSSSLSVLPADDKALSFELELVVLDGFVLKRGADTFAANGSMSGRVATRLARSSLSGHCTLATPVTRLSEVQLVNLSAVVDTPKHQAQGVLSSASLEATIGTWDEAENSVAGTVTVAEQSYEVSGPIDLNYEQTAFDDVWRCQAAALNPFVCDADAAIGTEIARHGLVGFQTLAELIEADPSCGFSSDAVRAGVQISGTVGSAEGTGVFTVAGCEIGFDVPTVVAQTCHGIQTQLAGRARISGTKTIEGWVTGDTSAPMISTSRDGVRYDLVLELNGLSLTRDDGTLALSVPQGSMAGVYTPRVALDADTGACTMLTPEARVELLTLSNAEVEVGLGARRVTNSNLFATIGRLSERHENAMWGSLSLDTTEVSLAAQPLVEDFDARAFEASFACREGMAIAADHKDCDMRQVLGEVGARLLVQSMASVTQVAGRDDFGCAFGSRGTLTDPAEVVGELDEFGSVLWSEPNCRLAFSNNRQGEPFNTSCEGDDQYFDGAATYDADRRMEGIRDRTRGADYIHPQTPNATTITYRNVAFENFAAYSYAPEATGPEHQIWIHSGSMSGVVEPFMAKGDGSHDAFNEGDFTVPSPVARFDQLAASNIDATISYDNKLFRVRIATASISAFSGSWEGAAGETNGLAGSIRIGDRTITLARNGDLNPDYDQAEFDLSYACANRLLEPIVPE